MTQTPRSPVKWRVNFPSGEGFNPDRPSLEAACRGNRTMGSLLNYFLFRASQEAEYQGLDESCKVVTISINREDILKTARISEKTLIGFLREFNELGYVLSARYSHKNTYEVHFEAVDKAITNPPERKVRGRPPKQQQEESCSNLDEENTSTYTAKLERKVEVLTGKLKSLEEKFTELQLLFTELSNKFTELQLSKSAESASGETSRAFSETSKNQYIAVEEKEDSVDASSIDTSAPVLSHPEDIVIEAQGVPVTYGECLAYLQQRGIPMEALDAVQVMQAARTLYVKQYPSQKGHTHEPDAADRPAVHSHSPGELPHLGIYHEQEASTPGLSQQQSPRQGEIDDGGTSAQNPDSGPGEGQVVDTLPVRAAAVPSSYEKPLVKPALTMAFNATASTTLSQHTSEAVQLPPGHDSPPADVTAPPQTISVPLALEDGQAAIAHSATAAPHGSSAQSGAGASKGKRGKKDGDVTQAELKEPPQMPPDDAPWGTNTCKQLFDYWRKKPLLSTYQLGESSKLAKALTQNYTREQVENSRNYMHDEAEWWSEHPEKVDIFSVAKHIHEMLEKMEQKIKRKGAMNGNGKPLQYDFSNGLNYFKPDDFGARSTKLH